MISPSSSNPRAFRSSERQTSVAMTLWQVMMSASQELKITLATIVTALLPTTYQKLKAERESKPRTPNTTSASPA